MVKEWDLLRAVACVSIVLLHTTTWVITLQAPETTDVYTFLRLILCFATPTFILLSIIILANRYPNQLPKKFWSSRILYIYLPFVAFSAIDAFNRMSVKKGFGEYFYNNIVFGRFTGWFILVIFQLYILYWLVTKFKWSRWIVFPLCIVASYVHFNELVFSEEFYATYALELRITATIWLIYFVFAYFVGRYYNAIAPWLLKARYVLLLLVAWSIQYLYGKFDTLELLVESRTIYLVPTVITLTLAILAWGQLIPKMQPVDFVSRYAFAIYLGHWPVMFYTAPIITQYVESVYISTPLIFMTAICGSALFAFGLQYVPGGQFVVGKVKKKRKPEPVAVVEQVVEAK
ncbi:MAG: acyltransferase family protein [Caryophanon sp.]|nr:acyltransferase family protein [Caryophanon sp.]